jgi:hypothetical protein
MSSHSVEAAQAMLTPSPRSLAATLGQAWCRARDQRCTLRQHIATQTEAGCQCPIIKINVAVPMLIKLRV